MKLIILIVISFSWLLADFTREGNVVTDNISGLQWQDDGHAKWAERNAKNWKNAIAYCRDLSLDDKDDWRLPNINELDSIVDYTRADQSIDPIFTNSSNHHYWSSTTYINQTNFAWYIDFVDGYKGDNYKTIQILVRCVRGEIQ
jgi:hypothetical protein